MPPFVKKSAPISREPVSSNAAQVATKSHGAALEQPLPSSSVPVSDETTELPVKIAEKAPVTVETIDKPLSGAPQPVVVETESFRAKVKEAGRLARDRMTEFMGGHRRERPSTAEEDGTIGWGRTASYRRYKK
jgi:hypothetical protein